MRMMLLAAVFITLPAIIVVIWFFDDPRILAAALGSFTIGAIPFIVALLLMRKQKPQAHGDESHH